jgi:hypothetical protein
VVNPRLTDDFDLPFTQADVPFAIPREADLPLCIDPFLLWSSSDAHVKGLHGAFASYVDTVRSFALSNKLSEAIQVVLRCREARELGLGYGQANKQGQGIGPQLANAIVEAIRGVPQFKSSSPDHVETLQLLVPRLKEDRISDLAAFVLRPELVRVTQHWAMEWKIPTREVFITDLWDGDSRSWQPGVKACLPYQKATGEPILLAPLAWLRHLPWINYEDYYRSFYAAHILPPDRTGSKQAKDDVLAYNRANYEQVEAYVKVKERSASQCFPEYAFEQLSLSLQKHVFKSIEKTAPGNTDGADKKFESDCFDLLRSALCPPLDFADNQVRTLDGVHIRDVIFYNDAGNPFLEDLRKQYDCRQLIFELKNVASVESEHVNQLFRYLGGDFGRLGFLVARRPPTANVRRNIAHLHASKRIAIICLSDLDLKLFVDAQEARQPGIVVLKKSYIEFQRSLPS